MNSKERIHICLDHKEADRVPIQCWYTPEVAEYLKDVLGIKSSKQPQMDYQLDIELGNDLLYTQVGILNSFNVIYNPKRRTGKDTFVCDWGIKWKKVPHEGGVYAEMVEHPLAGDMKKLDSYRTPNPNNEEEYKITKEVVKKYGKDYAIVGCAGSTVFEASWYLRGMEQFLIDLVKNQDFVNALMDKILEYNLIASKKLVEIGVDILNLGDDVGMQTNMLISPQLYRKYIKPRYAKIIEECKKINPNLKVAYHTDGYVEPVIQDFIEIGIDILHPIQPESMKPGEIKKKYGSKLSFWGTVDVQYVMQFGKTKEVINEVKERIKTVAPRGGFILCPAHYVQPSDRAIDNIFAFYWAANKYGKYPIKV